MVTYLLSVILGILPRIHAVFPCFWLVASHTSDKRNIHWKDTENHTENLYLLFKYWSLHFANHTEKLLITLKKYCAGLQCNHVENHLGWLRWISVLILGKRLNNENALKCLWKISGLLNSFVLGNFMDFRVTLKFSEWFSVLKFHSVMSVMTERNNY